MLELNLSRREFIKRSALAIGAVASSGTIISKADELFAETPSANDLIVVKNGSISDMVKKAVDELGGISKFVSKGAVVIVKPNIGWDRVPAQAANTNPEVVAEVIKLCFSAGASKVKVFDRTCNVASRCYDHSGIKESASKAGADVSFIVDAGFSNFKINGDVLKEWPLYKPAMEADVFINVPVVKHHGLSKMSLAMKNVMGIMGGDRGTIHNDYDRKIVDTNTVVKSHLIIMDATRILTANGPQGGNLADVKKMDTIIAGTNVVTIDAYTVSLFGQYMQGGAKIENLGWLKYAGERGLGEIDVSKMKVKEVKLG